MNIVTSRHQLDGEGIQEERKEKEKQTGIARIPGFF